MDIPQFEIYEPLEVRLTMAFGGEYRLVASANRDRGTIGYSLTMGGGGVPYSLSNLQARATFPGKIVKGWQTEVVTAIESSLATITEVR